MISRGCCLAASLSAFLFVSVGGLAQEARPISTEGLRASVGSVPPPDTLAARLTPELRGDIFMARKMYREAIDMYRQGPVDSAVLANKIGIAFHEMIQLDLAKRYYELAIKLNPKYGEAINNLGTIYYAQKSYRRAIGCYKKALRNSPISASIDANLGSAYFARHDFKRASDWYNAALKIDPDILEHHNSFGILIQERTTTDLAIFHLYLAKVYAKLGDNDRALVYLRKALEEGIHDRNKIPDMPEFVVLKREVGFRQLLAENPKPL